MRNTSGFPRTIGAGGGASVASRRSGEAVAAVVSAPGEDGSASRDRRRLAVAAQRTVGSRQLLVIETLAEPVPAETGILVPLFGRQTEPHPRLHRIAFDTPAGLVHQTEKEPGGGDALHGRGPIPVRRPALVALQSPGLPGTFDPG